MTWRSPNGHTFNQIDHNLIDARHYSNVLDTRSFRGANADTDHLMVVSKLRCRISYLKFLIVVKIAIIYFIYIYK